MKFLLDFLKDERGGECLEHGVITVVITIASIGGYTVITDKVSDGLGVVADGINSANGTPGG